MQSRLLSALLLALLSFSISLGLTAREINVTSYHRLVRQITRPTSAQIVNALHSQTHLVPKKYLELTPDTRNLVSSIFLELPEFINLLETAYPNGIYAPLGRDAVMLGDALEAYYLSRGETDRVHRINASGATIRYSDPEMLMKYLMQDGLNVDQIIQGRPFVLFDRTEYSDTSQTRIVLNAISAYLKTKKFPAANIPTTLGAIGISEDLSENLINAETLSVIQDYLNSRKKPSFKAPDQIFGFKSVYLGEGLIDTEEWHGPFAGITEDQNKLVVPFQPSKDLDSHKSILATQTIMIHLISQPVFKTLMEWQARGFGMTRGRNGVLRHKVGAYPAAKTINRELLQVLRSLNQILNSPWILEGSEDEGRYRLRSSLIGIFFNMHSEVFTGAERDEWLVDLFKVIDFAFKVGEIDENEWREATEYVLTRAIVATNDLNIDHLLESLKPYDKLTAELATTLFAEIVFRMKDEIYEALSENDSNEYSRQVKTKVLKAIIYRLGNKQDLLIDSLVTCMEQFQ